MRRTLILIYFFVFVIVAGAQVADPMPIVSIYDEFDDGLFGKSRYRGVVVSVKKAAFARAETLDVFEEDDAGYITAVVMDRRTVDKLLRGDYELPFRDEGDRRIYTYRAEGLDISFSVEKPKASMIQMVSDFYSDNERWHNPLVEHYRENYVIRIHRAENIFDSWSEDITYNEAMVAATLLGDKDQWLWGIHDGIDILNYGY